ncbi:glycosyltransferase [Candidatus Pelagibacter sp.]|nr:glycosyltransferase [Candidatus Pelagibacter sp.]
MKKNSHCLINKRKKSPFFSVITVVKNNEIGISNTIRSIINQKYKNFEYLIIDGKSEDKTIPKILKYKKRINYLSSKLDKGIYYAMNEGIKISKGKVIIFVNSGDLLKKKALYEIEKIFNHNKKIDFVFGTVKRHYLTSTIIKYGYNKKRLLYNFDFATAHSTGFFLKKNIFLRYGLFNTEYKCSADYDLYYRLIIKKNLIGDYTKKNILIGEVQKGGFSSRVSFFDHLIEETKIRFNNKQNLIFILFIFLNAIIKFFFKKIQNR